MQPVVFMMFHSLPESDKKSLPLAQTFKHHAEDDSS